MNNSFIKIFLIIFIFNSGDIFPQQLSETKFPSYSIYSGASLSSGLRIGGRMQINNSFSFEGSCGLDLGMFFGPSDTYYRYAFGINWHTGIMPNLIFNLSYIYPVYSYNLINHDIIFSLNIGSLTLQKKGICLFYQAGLIFKNVPSMGTRITNIYPNIDIGLGYNF